MKTLVLHGPSILRYVWLLHLLLLVDIARAAMEDDPTLYKFMLDELEVRDTDSGQPLVWEGQGWIGKDLSKFWFKFEGERLEGRTEEMEVQALYSMAIDPFWDLQLGLRHDTQPGPNKDWAVIGVQGLAPYLFETDLALFIDDSGNTALRLEAEYELLFTQRLILSPEIEINLYGQNDPDRGVGSGLSDIEAGLRLRYEIKRELAPYVGINWRKLFSNSADFARAEGESTDDLSLVLGVRFWF